VADQAWQKIQPYASAFIDTLNNQDVRENLKSIGASIGTELKGALEWLNTNGTPYVQGLWSAFQSGGLGGLAGKLGTDLSGLWANTIWPEISTWPGRFWEWIAGKGGVLETLTPELNKLADGMVLWSVSKDTITKMESIGDAVAGAIVGTVTSDGQGTKAIGGFAGALTRATAAMAGTFAIIGVEVGKGLVDGIATRLQDKETVDKIGGAMNSMIVKVNDNLNPFHFAFKWVEDNIPGFANGGIVPGPLGAPMLAVVHGGEQILPAVASGTVNYWQPTFNYGNAPANAGLDVQMMRFAAGA
jgi:hypothetical protein